MPIGLFTSWATPATRPPSAARRSASIRFCWAAFSSSSALSAFSLDFAFLMQRHEQMQAAFYLVGSVALSILAFYAGMSLTRWLLT